MIVLGIDWFVAFFRSLVHKAHIQPYWTLLWNFWCNNCIVSFFFSNALYDLDWLFTHYHIPNTSTLLPIIALAGKFAVTNRMESIVDSLFIFEYVIFSWLIGRNLHLLPHTFSTVPSMFRKEIWLGMSTWNFKIYFTKCSFLRNDNK